MTLRFTGGENSDWLANSGIPLALKQAAEKGGIRG
jgi:hypothetical protein